MLVLHDKNLHQKCSCFMLVVNRLEIKIIWKIFGASKLRDESFKFSSDQLIFSFLNKIIGHKMFPTWSRQLENYGISALYIHGVFPFIIRDNIALIWIYRALQMIYVQMLHLILVIGYLWLIRLLHTNKKPKVHPSYLVKPTNSVSETRFVR